MGGGTLTLAAIDMLIDAVVGRPDVLFMNKTLRRKVNALMREAGQATEIVNDAFGRQIPSYAGIPIAVIEEDEQDVEILGFDEAGFTASIYAVRFGVKEFVSGLQCGELDVIDMGLYSGGTAYRTLIEWICGTSVFHPKAAARLCGISEDILIGTTTTTSSTTTTTTTT